MNIKYILKGLIATLLMTLAVTSCENYNEPLLDGIGNTREFSITGLTTVVRSQTIIELNWTTKETVDHYVIEFSADDPEFTTIAATITVTAAQLPVKVKLQGETLYSIRIKAVTPGLDDSKWTITSANTLTEQLFLPVVPGDIQAKQAILRWVPNSAVTNILVNPGSISHLITAEEKASGMATITGLTGETNYTATLYNSGKKRGIQTFTTGIDIGTGILVKTSDDIIKIINEAASGAILVFEPGDYTAQTGLITLNKSITLRGLRTYNKPLLKLNFKLEAGVNDFSLIDVDLVGKKNLTDTALTGSLIEISGAAAVYGNILISNSNLHDFPSNPVVYASGAGSKTKSFTIDNTIIKKFATSADLIDFRVAYAADIIIKNSTFDTCSSRDFIREDNKGTVSATGLTSNILIDKCTLYNLTATRILYVRFEANAITVTNTLFSEAASIYTNQSLTSPPVYSNNNYFNSPGLNTGVATNKPDLNGTTLDPQFISAATGDFTVKNQTIIDKKIGDPRWIK